MIIFFSGMLVGFIITALIHGGDDHYIVMKPKSKKHL